MMEVFKLEEGQGPSRSPQVGQYDTSNMLAKGAPELWEYKICDFLGTLEMLKTSQTMI